MLAQIVAGGLPNFIWLSIGGNDILDGWAGGQCVGTAETASALACYDLIYANAVTMLDAIYTALPLTQVVMFGYDFTNFVSTAECLELAVVEFHGDVSQLNINERFLAYDVHVLQRLAARYNVVSFARVPLWGTLQAHGSDVGEPVPPPYPNVLFPSPYKLMNNGCIHASSQGWLILMGALWNAYFAGRTATSAAPPALLPGPKAAPPALTAPIDREAVVRRHTPSQVTDAAHPPSRVFARTVGNGAFAFTVDALGLQTLNESTSFITTMADWGWHTAPYSPTDPLGALRKYNLSDFQTPVDGAGTTRTVRYPTGSNISAAPSMGTWLHANPHRANLLQLSLRWGATGAALAVSDIVTSTQTLDVYAGVADTVAALTGGAQLHIQAAVHPDVDLFSAHIAVEAAGCRGAVHVRLAFPYALGGGSEWSPAHDGAHSTVVTAQSPGRFTVERVLDGDSWRLDCSHNASWKLARVGPHALELAPPGGSGVVATDVSCLIAPPAFPIGAATPWLTGKRTATTALQNALALPSFPAVAAASAASWALYWRRGAFVDLASRTSDPRAFELERRVVLSLYHINALEAGAEPPAECGLLEGTYWSGTHHGE